MTEKERERAGTGMEIAVIGMAGRFPGAKNIEEFWENLKNGIESISFFSNKELEEVGIAPEVIKDPNYVSSRGILEDKEYFDASFFGYTPIEAEIMNPQMRIFHECAWEALENAGYNSEEYEGLIGIYAGASLSFYWEVFSHLSGNRSEIGELAALYLTAKDFINARVAYNLNLKGPIFSVHTACSTSLVALHLACRALLTGECKVALAGGITIMSSPKKGYLYREGMHLSPDGHCRAFDAKAKGMVEGEGTGLVVLKRLKNATSDGDYIYAVIKGSAINNDGRRKVAFAAPSIEGQAEGIRRALRIAGVEPETISYIETHGTGTTLGDPVEIDALKLAFNTNKKGFCAIGSVKTNIGHLDAAAGITSLIKTVLALNYQLIPPSLHFKTPNPAIDFENSPFYVNTALSEWKQQNGRLRAGVSSFGMGGTNAHMVLEEWPVARRQTTDHRGQKTEGNDEPVGHPYQLILLSAKSQTPLDKMTLNLAEYLKANPGINLADAAYTLQVGRKVFPHRRMLVCSNGHEAVEGLSSLDSRKLKSVLSKEGSRTVIFMFSGLGAQYADMGLELYQTEPLFREDMDRCFEILKPLMGYDVKEILYPSNMYNKSNRSYMSNINQTEIAQLVIFIFEYALAKLLMKWGIKPHAMIGYSFGEYAAACISGVFSLENALKLVVSRVQLIQNLSPGVMLSVPLSCEKLTPFLNPAISVAIDNGPSCVAAGSKEAIDAFEKKMNEKRYLCIRLQAGHALHSKMMEPILTEFEQIAAQITLNIPQIPYLSNVTGEWIKVEEATSPSYWAKHLRSTVRFADGIKKLVKEEKAVFIEIGPGRDLRSLVMRYIESNPEHQVVQLIRQLEQEVSDVYFLLDKIGKLWLYGLKINWDEFYSREKRSRIPLPTYPFERQRYSFEGNLSRVGTEMLYRLSQTNSKRDIADWFYVPSWERSFLDSLEVNDIGEADERRVNSCWLVFMDDYGWASRMLKQVNQEALDTNIITVKIGPEFKSENRAYTINPRQSADFDTLFKELLKLDVIPDKILHFWGITGESARSIGLEEIDISQDLGLYSLLHMVQAMGRQGVTTGIEIHVVTNNMQEVLGKDGRCPEKATVLGAVKVIPLEYPNISCRSIDIDILGPGRNRADVLICRLWEEFTSNDSHLVVAYRGDYRWVQTYKPLRLAKPSHTVPPFLKRKGVYLITGGLGGMGFTFAEYLAASLSARLILVGRSPFPPRDEWEHWLAAHDEKDSLSLKIRKIQELEQKGAEIITASADVANDEQMRGIISRAEKQFASINGVLHTAGVIDYAGVIQRRTHEMTVNVMAAKVRGTLVLDRILKHLKLDFMVLFSSLGNVLYRRKFGQVAYSAANEFLDAFALYKTSREGTFTVSINWTDWKEVGMAVEVTKQRHGNNTDNIDYDSLLPDALSPSEGIEVFNRILANRLHRAVVTTKDLLIALERENTLKNEVIHSADTFEEAASHEILYQRPELSSSYTAPRNQVEEKLARLFQKFFGIEKVGIYDDFFELGGDSLKAMGMISKIHRELEVEVPITEFFSRPLIETLAEFINNTKRSKFYSIQPVEKKECYAVSSAQKRLYFLQYLEEENINYNQPQAHVLEGACHMETLEQISRELIKQHESLRTSFEMVDDEPVQRIHDNDDVTFEIECWETNNAEPEEVINCFTRPFDLSKVPLFRLGVIKVEEKKSIVVWDIHHIISDGISNTLFRRDFILLYQGEEPPPLPIQYKEYSQWMASLKEGSAVKQQETYWLGELEGELPELDIPIDFTRPKIQSFIGKRISFKVGREETKAIKTLVANQGVTLFMFIFASYIILLSKLSGQEDIIVGVPTAGRGYPGLENIIGMFVNTLAIRNYPGRKKTFIEFLKEVKEKTLKAFENQNYQFEDLVEKIALNRDTSRNPLFDVMFQFENIDVHMPQIKNSDLTVKPYELKRRISTFDLTLIGIETDGELSLAFEYCIQLFKEETNEWFIKYFKEIVASVIKDPNQNLSEIGMSAEKEGKEDLAEFTDELEMELEAN